MRIVLAPNALKESLTARQAVEAMKQGVLAACPDAEVLEVPVADGGDGFADVVTDALGGETATVEATGPLGETVAATFGYLPEQQTALIEMASASGLALLPPERRNPMETSTRGTGDIIKAALDRGATRIVLGIGGSATCDGGTGVAAALGYEFCNESGHSVPPVGGALTHIHRIDASGVDPRIASCRVEVICDVTNTLYGPSGAAYVYGPQKGASEDQVKLLDVGLRHLAELIRRDLGTDVASVAGGGAAGGLGAGMLAFFGATLRPGIDAVLDLVDLSGALLGAGLVLTAEGAMDGQSVHGKAPVGVAQRASQAGVPCIAIAGGHAADLTPLHDAGLHAIVSLCPGPIPLKEAMQRAEELLATATEEVVRIFAAGQAASTRSVANTP